MLFTGFQASAEKFFLFVLVLFLTTVGGAAVGIAISSSVDRFVIANLLSTLIFILMMVNLIGNAIVVFAISVTNHRNCKRVHEANLRRNYY